MWNVTRRRRMERRNSAVRTKPGGVAASSSAQTGSVTELEPALDQRTDAYPNTSFGDLRVRMVGPDLLNLGKVREPRDGHAVDRVAATIGRVKDDRTPALARQNALRDG